MTSKKNIKTEKKEKINFDLIKSVELKKIYYKDILNIEELINFITSDLNNLINIRAILDIIVTSDTNKYLIWTDKNKNIMDINEEIPFYLAPLLNKCFNKVITHIDKELQNSLDLINKDPKLTKPFIYNLYHPFDIKTINGDVEQTYKVSKLSFHVTSLKHAQMCLSGLGFSKIEDIIESCVTFKSDNSNYTAILSNALTYFSYVDFLAITLLVRFQLADFLLRL